MHAPADVFVRLSSSVNESRIANFPEETLKFESSDDFSVFRLLNKEYLMMLPPARLNLYFHTVQRRTRKLYEAKLIVYHVPQALETKKASDRRLYLIIMTMHYV